MDKDLLGQQIFAAPRSKAETKADVTNKTARGIIEKEAEKRDIKTARLRQARLDKEAAEAASNAASAVTPKRSRKRSNASA